MKDTCYVFTPSEASLQVTAPKIRFYRLLQLVALLIIYSIKQIKIIAIMFPFVLVLLVLGRQHLLPLIYMENELIAVNRYLASIYHIIFFSSLIPMMKMMKVPYP